MSSLTMAVVMPAHNEAENLEATVADFFHALDAMSVSFRIIVVNDGSTDNTEDVLQAIEEQYLGLVMVLHHDVNRGYGAAMRTGIDAALVCGAEWVFLTDSDGQFRASQLEQFLSTALHERYSLVVGYRPDRADPFHRKISGACWTTLNRLINGVRVRDVDCAYKLIHRRTLSALPLYGEAAAISPELIAKAKVSGARVKQLPVDHFPREFGEQSGNNFRVIFRSLAGMLKLFWELFSGGHRFRLAHRLFWAKDTSLRRITFAAIVVSVVAAAYYYAAGDTLVYPDAVSHQLIAKRVIDSPTPGFGQLGGVWLPLPHVLLLPLVASSQLYYSGIAGTIISMLAFVIAARYIFRTGRAFAGRWEHGLVGFVVFAANPNVWYMQSTPMTEMLLLAAMSASLYYLLRWCQTGSWRSLSAASFGTMAACLIRYEGWVFAMGELAVIVYVCLRQRSTWDEAGRGFASLIFFSFMGIIAIPAWMLWNTAIFGDPLFFQNGSYAKPSLWVDRGDQVIGNWSLSARAYAIAVGDNLGPVVAALFVVGLICFIAKTKLRPETAAPLALLVLAPFFVYALHAGQRPLHVPQIGGAYYNVRFGLVQILPAAIFAAYLATVAGTFKSAVARRLPAVAVGVAAVVGAAAMGNTVTLTEAKVFAASDSEHANRHTAAWLAKHYDGGLVLMESFGNESVTFWSKVPTSSIIYEGSNARGGIWQRALSHPLAVNIRWIYVRDSASNPDAVASNLLDSQPLRQYYMLVYQHGDQRVYRALAGQPSRTGAVRVDAIKGGNP